MRAGALSNMLARHSAPAKAGMGLGARATTAAGTGDQRRRLPCGIPGLSGNETETSSSLRNNAAGNRAVSTQPRSASVGAAAGAASAAATAKPADSVQRQPLQESQAGNMQADKSKSSLGKTQTQKSNARAAAAPSKSKQEQALDASADKRKRSASAGQPAKAKAKKVQQAVNSDDDFM